ncbi:MAG: helix-hairpin-helix domain-containing protein [Burkholderiaceae bacterium]
MNPSKVDRASTQKLTDLPNVGPAMARDLESIGIHAPADLEGRDAWVLYQTLCERSGARQDPCVLDTFMSVVDYANGGIPKPWWAYTEERKRRYGRRLPGERRPR